MKNAEDVNLADVNHWPLMQIVNVKLSILVKIQCMQCCYNAVDFLKKNSQ